MLKKLVKVATDERGAFANLLETKSVCAAEYRSLSPSVEISPGMQRVHPITNRRKKAPPESFKKGLPRSFGSKANRRFTRLPVSAVGHHKRVKPTKLHRPRLVASALGLGCKFKLINSCRRISAGPL